MRRDALINVCGNLALAVLAVVSGKAVAVWFGASGRGVLGVSQVAIALAGTIGGLGLGDAILYRQASGRRPLARQVFRWGLLGSASAGLLGLAAGTVVGRWQESTVRPLELGLFVAGAGAATALLAVVQGQTRGSGDFLRWNATRIAATLAWIVALLFARGRGAALRIGWLAGAYVIMIVALALLPNRRLPRDGRPDEVTTRGLLSFGVPAMLGAFPQQLNARVDQFVLAAFSPASTLGYYAAAAGYCWAVVPLSQALANLLFTRVANQPDDVSRHAVLVRTVRLGTTAVLLSGVVSWALASWAVPLLNTTAFGPAVALARILLIGATLQAITFLLEEGTRGLGKPRIAMTAEVVGLVVMGLLLVLVARRSATAVAWASVAGYVASFVVVVGLASNALGLPWHRVIRPALPSRARRA